MVFSSSVFLFIFLPMVLFLYYLPINNRTYKNIVLLFASLLFYAWGEPFFVFVMLLSILINYLLALKLDKANGKKRKTLLAICVVFDIGLIFVFKYLGFAVRSLAALFNADWSVQLALPIGISFFTFQIMSYVFDVYYGNAEVQRSYLSLALYISMFPQLIAGPIVRYNQVAEEIRNRKENLSDFSCGFARFTSGLAKKVLLANYIALVADNIFAVTGKNISIATAWLGAVCYGLQIYFDFSGYSDMAIGLGRMFGFHFEENFNYPYTACSGTDFWRRWHISLSGWFRDYVYIPLGGKQGGTKKTVRNLFVVWLLTGLWHGANWTYIVWGLFWFVVLSGEKYLKFPKRSGVLSRIYTLLIVMIGWVIFRSDTLGKAWQYLLTMFGIRASVFSDDMFRYFLGNVKWVLIAGVLACLPLSAWARSIFSSAECSAGLRRLGSVSYSVLIGGLFVLCVLIVVKAGYNPFIYFQF